MSSLTKHQQEKFREILNFIKQGETVILLKGSAGVGKTWLVHTLIKELTYTIKPFKIMCSAPTHKALAVINSKVKIKLVKFSTVHSALQYRSSINKETGKRVFSSHPNDKWPPLKDIKYWIIDEASMIDTDMLKTILFHAKLQETTVIFVGDDKQLNPVDEEDSPVFNQKYPEVELTEIIRQGEGNPIITLSRDIPKIWERKSNLLGGPEGQDVGYLHTQNLARIIEELAKVNGTDEFKYLAWTNKEVDKINKLVRHRIYGDNPDKIELGETIIFNAPYKNYTTNETVEVLELEKTTINQQIVLKDQGTKQSISVEFNIYIINKNIKVLNDSSLAIFKKYSTLTNKNCKDKMLSYVERNYFLSIFADFNYNHALTIHKSQGSTYKTTVLNVRDINFNQKEKEKQRLFYTGVTRASDLLILYNV
jgi:ATP-dependent exoDNAse (exonuclease V) alpha subunit